MTTVNRIVAAVQYTYTGGKITSTTLYFNDATSLTLNDHWVFRVGESYTIEYVNGNPVTVNSVTMRI